MVLVRSKSASIPVLATSASTVYEPLTSLAVRVGALATPLVLVGHGGIGGASPGKVALGPLVGATNSTSDVRTGHPPVSIDLGFAGGGEAVPTLAVWADPPVDRHTGNRACTGRPVAAEAGARRQQPRQPEASAADQGHAGEEAERRQTPPGRGPPALSGPMIMEPAGAPCATFIEQLRRRPPTLAAARRRSRRSRRRPSSPRRWAG